MRYGCGGISQNYGVFMKLKLLSIKYHLYMRENANKDK